MKIIFLDIDGVVNTRDHIRWRLNQPEKKRGTHEDWCGQACENINKLAHTVPGDVGIVMSSSWRLGRPIMELRKLLEHNEIKVPLIDKTPHLNSDHCRGDEVEQWFASPRRIHAIEKYVILDDGCDFLPKQLGRLVECCPSDGFANFKRLKKAIDILSQ